MPAMRLVPKRRAGTGTEQGTTKEVPKAAVDGGSLWSHLGLVENSTSFAAERKARTSTLLDERDDWGEASQPRERRWCGGYHVSCQDCHGGAAALASSAS